jgi:hypothetical protein
MYGARDQMSRGAIIHYVGARFWMGDRRDGDEKHHCEIAIVFASNT